MPEHEHLQHAYQSQQQELREYSYYYQRRSPHSTCLEAAKKRRSPQISSSVTSLYPCLPYVRSKTRTAVVKDEQRATSNRVVRLERPAFLITITDAGYPMIATSTASTILHADKYTHEHSLLSRFPERPSRFLSRMGADTWNSSRTRPQGRWYAGEKSGRGRNHEESGTDRWNSTGVGLEQSVAESSFISG